MALSRVSWWSGAVLSSIVVVVTVPRWVEAQELYGSIVGAVQDGFGARVPGATIEIRNRDTNLILSVTSNDAGVYMVTNVLPGNYDVKVTLQGFKEFIQQRVPVSAGSISRVDVRLEIGQISDSVTVVSRPALLKTDKADTGSAFSSREVVDLPLPDFRNYQSLLDLVPGSTPAAFQNAEIDTPARALQATINGTNPNTNSTRVDGALNQNTWLPHHTLYVAPAETIAEVNVTTGSFSADQGLAGGAAISVITKSGTNQLRGSGFGFYTDERLRAQSFFARGSRKLPTKHNIDGGTVGGPIVTNKVFYFGAFEGQYRNSDGASVYTVPTEKMRRGDFSDAFRSDGSLQLIYDPRTGAADGRGRAPFDGNVIPANRLDAVAQKINAFYPLPNRPGNTSNYFKQYVNTFVRNNYDVKINWNQSPGRQFWGKIGVMDATVSDLQKLAFDGGGLGRTKTWVATIGQTFTPSKSLVIDSTVGYSLNDQWGHGPDYGTNYGLSLGVPGTNGPDIRQSGMPEWGNGMSAQGATESWAPYTRYDPTYTAAANVTRLAGAHAVRFGGTVDRTMLNHWQPEIGVGPRGSLSFSGNLTGLRGGPQAPNAYNSYASFLLGLTSSVSKSLQWETMRTREWHLGFYLGDRWQPRRDLTLDLGVRYEYFPIVTRANGRGVERLDLSTMDVFLGGVGGVPRDVGLITSKTDFAPRLGVAWRVNESTVARGGYGLTYNPLPFARPLRGFYPLTIANTYVSLNSWQPYGTLEAGIPEFSGPPAGEGRVPLPAATTMRTPDPDNVQRGYIQSWNASVQRKLPLDMSVDAAYVGTKTTRGYADVELNVSPPGGGERGRAFFSQFGRTASTLLWGGVTRAQYHALQIQLNRPFKKGLLLRSAYTFGKTMNVADQDGWVGLSYNAPEVFARNYAPAGFDRRHTFTLAYVYQVPQRSEGGARIVKTLLGGWQLNGVFAAYSGTPFTVTGSNASLDQRGNLQTADQVGPLKRLSAGPYQLYYDPSAWEDVRQQRYGNSGRNQYYGPGFWNYNMSLFRSFRLQGRVRLQFRLEGFSVTNTPQWANPNSDVNGGDNFMRILGTRGGARSARLGLRLEF